MPTPHHAKRASTISSAPFHSFASSSSSSVDHLPAYSPTDSDDGVKLRRQYPTITTVRIRRDEVCDDDEPLSATLKRLGAKRKTAILPPKVEGDDDDEWEDIVEPNFRPRKPSGVSLRNASRSISSSSSSRRALRNLKPLPAAPPTATASQLTPVPDGWGGRLTRPSWFPSHQPGPLLKTPAPIAQSSLKSLLQPLPGAGGQRGDSGANATKAVRFASLLPTWRSQSQSRAASGAAGVEKEERLQYEGGYSIEHDPLPRYQQDPAWPREDAQYPSAHTGLSQTHTTLSRRSLLIRSLFALLLLTLLLGLAIGLSSHCHSHLHPHSHARPSAPSSASAATASRIKPGDASTEKTVHSATTNANGGVPTLGTTPSQGAPPLLVSSTASSSAAASHAAAAASSVNPPKGSSTSATAASATHAPSSAAAASVFAGSHHAALVSQAVAQAGG